MALSPGERIDIKKRIAAALGAQPWEDVDLVLREFGFSTTDRWEGGERPAYVLQMLSLSGSKDDALIELDSYLHPAAEAEAEPQPDTFEDPLNPWNGHGLRLFVSHVSAYASQAARLRASLGRRSVDCFVAHDSITPTEEWKRVIQNALRSCDACLALLTPGFAKSDWTDQEVGFCIGRDLLVIPADFGVIPYGFLGDFQAMKIRAGMQYGDIAQTISGLLIRKPQSRDAMARALVDRWSRTSSWDGARENYAFLKQIPDAAWTQQLVDDVWEARDRAHDLRTAYLDGMDSDVALRGFFNRLGYKPPGPPPPAGPDDEIPF